MSRGRFTHVFQGPQQPQDPVGFSDYEQNLSPETKLFDRKRLCKVGGLKEMWFLCPLAPRKSHWKEVLGVFFVKEVLFQEVVLLPAHLGQFIGKIERWK